MALLEAQKLGLDAAILFHRAIWFTPETLPVVGLDVISVQDNFFLLRSLDHGNRNVASAYLRAIQCAQLAHDRLLHDLNEVDRNLAFWQRQVSAGSSWSHGAFMLLSRGPVSFARDTLATALLVLTAARDALLPLLARLHQQAQGQMDGQESGTGDGVDLGQQAAGAPGMVGVDGQRPRSWIQTGRALSGALSGALGEALLALPLPPPAAGCHQQPQQQPSDGADAGGSGRTEAQEEQGSVLVPELGLDAAAGGAGASATDLMQQRVLLLRGLRQRLAWAVAQLTEAAAHLHLGPLLEPVDVPLPRKPHMPASAASAGAGLRGFAASAAADNTSPGTEVASTGSSVSLAIRSHQRLQVEQAVLTAVRGMTAALQGLLMPPHRPQHEGHQGAAERQPPSPPSAISGAGGGSGPPPAPCPSPSAALEAELGRLLDVLRLQPVASQVMSLPAPAPQSEPPPPQSESQEAPSSSAAPPASSAGDGGGGGGGVVAPAAGLHVVSGRRESARSALDAARRAAALSGPLLPLPAAARMPSRFQRHWLRYCAAGGLLLYGGVFLYRHSRLAGSDDLDRWVHTVTVATRAAFRTHVAEPLAAVRDELFRTFRDRPAIISSDDFALSRESLLRMLSDYAADHKSEVRHEILQSQHQAPPSGTASAVGVTAGGAASPSPSPVASLGAGSTSVGGGGGVAISSSGGGERAGGGGEDVALAAGMAVLMRSYEEELRSPLRNLVLGDLARALLIQVQHVKVDGEAAMLRLDQILRANELTVSLMAALPAMALAAAMVAGLARLLIPRAPDPRREAVPSRLAMAALEVALEEQLRAEAQLPQPQASLPQPRLQQQGPAQEDQAEAGGAAGEQCQGSEVTHGCAGAASSGGVTPSSSSLQELRGVVVYRLYQAYLEVVALYRRADRSSRFSEWRPLHADLLRLAAPGLPTAERLATHRRIMRTYTVFQA